MKGKHITNTRTTAAAGELTSEPRLDARLAEVWNHPAMQALRRAYTEPFTVKIARTVFAATPTDDLAMFLARHILQQPCEHRDVRMITDSYVVSSYFRADGARLVLHTNRQTHVTSVIMLRDVEQLLDWVEQIDERSQNAEPIY